MALLFTCQWSWWTFSSTDIVCWCFPARKIFKVC